MSFSVEAAEKLVNRSVYVECARQAKNEKYIGLLKWVDRQTRMIEVVLTGREKVKGTLHGGVIFRLQEIQDISPTMKGL